MSALIIDCETTGLTFPSLADIKQQPHIIEFAAVRVASGKIISEFEQLINPGFPISEEITKITGITDEMVRDAPTFKKALPAILNVLRSSDTLIAHNAPFDCACIEFELRRAGERCEGGCLPPTVICTVQEFAHEFGRRPKLTELYERKIGKPLMQTHRALDDVRALAEIVIHERLA